jgi:hypothetical protein
MKKFTASLTVIFVLFLNVSCSESIATSTPIPTNTLSPTSTPIPSPTATNIPVYDITVQAFHDYNGNGIIDVGEPSLEGVVNKTANAECTTGADGTCTLEGVMEGNQKITLNTTQAVNPTGEQVPELNYLFYGTKVLSPSSGISVAVDGDIAINTALGQGYLSIPLLATSYGGTTSNFETPNSRVEGGVHFGIDFLVMGKGEQPVFANVSGKLNYPEVWTKPWGGCGIVQIRYTTLEGREAIISPQHIDRIILPPKNGTVITKGQIIGYINPDLYGSNKPPVACTTTAHVHFGVYGDFDGAKDVVNGKWQPVISGWGYTNPNLLMALKNSPIPMFIDLEQALQYNIP